ncbi:MAG: RC-LH1 core complex protein PufX [Pseudomonadota bacterium]
MSEKSNSMLGTTETFRLRMDVLGLMLKGAGYAALFVIGVWLFVYVIHLVGKLLPPESKEASDPTPLSFWLDAVQSLPFA